MERGHRWAIECNYLNAEFFYTTARTNNVFQENIYWSAGCHIYIFDFCSGNNAAQLARWWHLTFSLTTPLFTSARNLTAAWDRMRSAALVLGDWCPGCCWIYLCVLYVLHFYTCLVNIWIQCVTSTQRTTIATCIDYILMVNGYTETHPKPLHTSLLSGVVWASHV